jgi:CRISPR-associated endonuclease Cas2
MYTTHQGTSMSTKLRLGPATKAILATIAFAGVISVIAIAPALPMAIAPFIKKKKPFQRNRLVRDNIRTLKRQGLITLTKRANNQVEVRLTRRGIWEVGIRNYTFSNPRTWDRKWRIVIFDVPEQKRKIRNELRRAMKLYGFQQLQQSVWVYPHPCDEFVKLIKQHLGIAPDVLYLTTTSIENEKYLRRQFKLT